MALILIMEVFKAYATGKRLKLQLLLNHERRELTKDVKIFGSFRTFEK